MRQIISILIILLATSVKAQPPTIEWQKCLGGSGFEVSREVKQTSDGGYLLIGNSASTDGDVTGLHSLNKHDYWVVKLDSLGSLQWQKCYGGSDEDMPNSFLILNDHSFILAGYTASIDGDVTVNHGSADYWLIKCDSVGNIEWQKCYGGSDDDVAYQIIKTLDGGYGVIGSSISNDQDVVGSHVNAICTSCQDIWFLKLDSLGNIETSKCFGGGWGELGNGLIQKNDSSFVIYGATRSDDGDVQGLHGGGASTNLDSWILSSTLSGNLQAQQCLGGNYDEIGNRIIPTFDYGYLMVGITSSNDSLVSGNHGFDDMWVVKIDSLFNIEWQRCFGGSLFENATNVIQLPDSGYLILGYTNSNDGDVSGIHGTYADVWLIKISQTGMLEWQKCLGGSLEDQSFDMQITHDGGLIVSGVAFSSDGDVSSNHGNGDVWIIKLGSVLTNIKPIGITNGDDLIIACPNNKIDISIYTNKNESITLEIIDVTGRIIIQKSVAIKEGLNRINDLPQVRKGMYFARLVETDNVVCRPFIIQQ